MRFFLPLLLSVAAVAAACSSEESGASAPSSTTPPATAQPEPVTVALEPEDQRPGDPAKGYDVLVNESYVPCGIPWSLFQNLGPAKAENLLPGRRGRNTNISYTYTAFTTKDGVELVGSNCLLCHTGRIDGKLVVGLGGNDVDFTESAAAQIERSSMVASVVTDPKELAEVKKWKTRVDTVAPYAVLSTRGLNPADSFTAILFAHHDPKTLAWTEKPMIDVPPPMDVPVDTPPWWHMKKKTSMFYVGAGRGDHARIMMTASILCTSSVEESQAIDAWFGDVRAYIASIEPPKYPFPVDAELASHGRDVFEKTCSRCHGTYGPGGSYPNRLVMLEDIGTDSLLAMGSAQFGKAFTEWFANSFFGETARLEPKEGYVAPPLDGIWATAPYLHNGSVPTIAALLDSGARPAYWQRNHSDSSLDSYDQTALGWKTRALAGGKKSVTDADLAKSIYDTTLPGYSNGGHTFGDQLAEGERTALIEYLKTL
jgi:cytochrome c5